nr:hypothetical protein [Tanacetum cinerariifolium]
MSSSHATVTYTSISSDDDLPSWGIPLMEAYESDPEAHEVSPQSSDQAPLSLVHDREYSQYLAPSDDDLPTNDQPLPDDASPTALSPGYIADSEPIEDGLEGDPEMGPEEEPLALALSASPVPDFSPSPEETEPFEEGKIAATSPPPVSSHTIVPLSQTSLRRGRKT